ncbi:8150_t:CDS:2 [Diversispora eburnea]|uniref:8150_t:CDS:1 n=1 Tax=Diversispora eburnea TaxID=1213867 RepID=A0A9N8ZTM4_9GLOM|nr:8150_t:CDS:2 [Diversispora eburnea]
MSIAGSILLENRDNDGNIIDDKDTQSFEGLNFKIKLSTIPGSRNSAILIFLKENGDETSIPKFIRGEDVSDTTPTRMVPIPGTQYFLIEHLPFMTIFSLTPSVFGFGIFTHNETNSFDTTPRIWLYEKYFDGIVVIRIANVNPNDGELWLRPVLSLHPVNIYALQKSFLLVLYYNASNPDDINTHEEWGCIIDWNGNLYDKVNFSKANIENGTLVPDENLLEGNIPIPFIQNVTAYDSVGTVDEGYSIIMANVSDDDKLAPRSNITASNIFSGISNTGLDKLVHSTSHKTFLHELPTISTGWFESSIPCGDNDYLNFQVNSTSLSINENISTLTNNITITYYETVELSDGNITIYQTEDNQFFADLHLELSKIIPVNIKRLNSNRKTQVDTTVSPNHQILILLNIESSNVASIIDDLNEMITHKRMTSITTKYLDKDFGFKPKCEYI